MINSNILSIKKEKFNNLLLKFKYDRLSSQLGYIFTFNIMNEGKTEEIIEFSEDMVFYITNIEKREMFWEKSIDKPSFPLNIKKTSKFILKPDDMISFTYIYDYNDEDILPKAEWRLGVKCQIGTNNFSLFLPLTTRPKKGFGKLFR